MWKMFLKKIWQSIHSMKTTILENWILITKLYKSIHIFLLFQWLTFVIKTLAKLTLKLRFL